MKRAAIVAIIISGFLLTQMPNCSAQLSHEMEDKTLSIITNVIGLDMKEYTAELYNHNSHSPDGYEGLILEDVAYNLSAANSKVLAVCTFIGQSLVRWDLTPLDSPEFSPIYSQHLPTSRLEAVKQTLQRCQAYSGSPLIQEALAILQGATIMETGNVTKGDLTMRVAGDVIDWVRTINGLEFPTGLSIRLSNGFVDMFNDESKFYRTGSSDVNITREEAIRIAREKAETFTTVNIWVGNDYQTFLFNVRDEPQIVRLQVGTANLTSYPYWYVWFMADPEVYSVTGFEVSLRADTGEIAYSQTTGYYGEPSPDATSTASPEPTAEPASFPTTLLIGSVVAVAAVVGVGLLVYFKKRKR